MSSALLIQGKDQTSTAKFPGCFNHSISGIFLKPNPWGLSHYVPDMFVNPVKPFPEPPLPVWHRENIISPPNLCFFLIKNVVFLGRREALKLFLSWVYSYLSLKDQQSHQ